MPTGHPNRPFPGPLALGRRKIAFIGDASEHAPEFSRRYEGHVQALREAGSTIDPTLQMEAETSEEGGARGVAVMQERGVAFDALFEGPDVLCISRKSIP